MEKQNDDLKKIYVQLKEQQAVECHQKRKREEEFTNLESSHAQLSSRFDAPLGIAATQRRTQLQQEKRIRNRFPQSNLKVTKSNSKVNHVEKQNDDLKQHYVQLKEQ